ncbi:MAG: hypothetical protein GKR96_11810 [Gammaproteobacteria bacterium]|nr:hypothetical protein [Gammaproteobacteria bacterium]
MEKNIDRFISAATEKVGKINPLYRRNFSELLKIIPIVGSWIERNSIGAIEDEILEERLIKLDEACSRALSIEDANSLFVEITNINSIFFIILLTKFEEIQNQSSQSIDNLGNLVGNLTNDIAKFLPNPKFKFITISGASAVGKDTMLDLILSQKDKSPTKNEALTKFTTRAKRPVDSKYYDFVTEEQFNLLDRSGQIIFPYLKRGSWYGFDRTHLFNAAREDMILWSVFTHFQSLATDRAFLRSQGINHIAVLLSADINSLTMRSESRILDQADIASRISSIQLDLQFLMDNETQLKKCFDLIVENDDGHAKWDSYNTIVDYLGLESMMLHKL